MPRFTMRIGRSAVRVRLGVIACILAVSSIVCAQGLDRESLKRQSETLAFDLGMTFEMGQRCNVALDGLSRRSASILFGRFMYQGELDETLTYYDAGTATSGRTTCDQRWLTEQITAVGNRMRAYLQAYRSFALR